MKLLRSVLFAIAALLPLFAAAQSEALHTKAELVSNVNAVAPGQEFWLALRLESQPKWHTYWLNPGEAGFASELIWQDKPSGVTVGEGFLWPAPIYYLQGGIISYVYEGETFLLIRAKAEDSLKEGETLRFTARADWLECDDKGCWPGGADVELTLSVVAAQADAQPSQWATKIEKTIASLPRALPQWVASAEPAGPRTYLLTLRPTGETGAAQGAAEHAGGATQTGSAAQAGDAAQGGDAAQTGGTKAAAAANTSVHPLYFFPLSQDIAAAEPEARKISVGEDGSLSVQLKLSDVATSLEEIEGVFTAQNGWLADGSVPALKVKVSVTGSTQAGGGIPAGAGTSDSTQLSFHLLGLAFVGGLILNLMPCVFPVLGIKVMGFVQQAGSERRKVVLHGLAFTAGVLISFWILSGVLIALRQGGAELGWGFQLQSPAFVAGLTVLLLVFGLSLSGVFDVGYGAMSVGSELAAKTGFKGSFFSGVLATVVATPCAAPFLAPALGAALALPAFDSLIVFTAVAIGLAAPYLVLSAFPALIKLLPRPGAWMETFKQLMAFLLYATVAYLVWTLAGLVNEEWFLNVVFGLVAIAAAAWAYGRWLKPGSQTRVRGWVLTVVFAVFGGWLVFSPVRPLEWEDWSPERVAQLQAQGRPVYVDFTARWCATCQVNKRVVFSSEEVLERFKKDRVAMLKADWTDRNDTITAELAKYGRSAVPFNLLYGAKSDNEPLILPELLTPGIVLDALDKLQTQ